MCRSCGTVQVHPLNCMRCPGAVELVPSSLRTQPDGSPFLVCGRCSAPVGSARYCTHCGYDRDDNPAQVVPTVRAEVLAAAFESAGLRRPLAPDVADWVALAPDEVLLSSADTRNRTLPSLRRRYGRQRWNERLPGTARLPTASLPGLTRRARRDSNP